MDSLSPFAPENLMSRDGFGRPIPRHAACLFSIARLNLVLTYGISPDFRGGVHLFIQTAIRHRVSSKFIGPHAIAYRWRSLPIVRRRRASKPQGSSSNGCCLCITMKQLICLSFPHPLWKTIRNKTLSAMSQTRLKLILYFFLSEPLRSVVVVVVFTLKAVPVSTQYFLTSVLVQLTRTPSVVTG